ncbi:DNA-(apurinic or apyrimidinic site) lyase/endonuclease 4 [Blumeria hordei DH14]|uniref:Apurinic-apyrimidinic endonuclease 1 n=1 Tax=Blumeria graminis f. sp. hordei (strain DH14) TaxID=546991 RepID=N1J999_BLUG1|nr:DNA-(apurinic or apyrimidinic site) lyase/endonuclease 4 [Blumeria hordei DH14]
MAISRKRKAEEVGEANKKPTKSQSKSTSSSKHVKDAANNETNTRSRKKQKKADETEVQDMPLAPRTLVSTLKKPMLVGAHVSAAGGVQNSIQNALHIGGNAFALFLKSQRKWISPPLSSESRDQFKVQCLENSYDAAKHVLPHGSYLVNLAQSDPEKAQQAYTNFVDDLHRCEELGIRLYNFHPGNSGKTQRHEAIQNIATQLNKAHKATKTVITLLENMAGAGNVIGSTWEDLRDIISLIDDKSRVGVCLDTCHTFAAGYDLRTPEAFEATMNSFSSIVGMPYLKALHLNDSKAPFSSNRDVHGNIGTGFLGLTAFHSVMNYVPFQGLPMILETPIDIKTAEGKTIEDKSIWAKEIRLLESLIDADLDTETFKEESEKLQSLGAMDRKKFQAQVDKKISEADKKQQKTLDMMLKGTRAKRKGKPKSQETELDSEDSNAGCKH